MNRAQTISVRFKIRHLNPIVSTMFLLLRSFINKYINDNSCITDYKIT
jgi:hypothetical protein